jgi:small conductance mechanosensitive channel
MELQIETIYGFISMYALKFFFALIIFFIGKFAAKYAVKAVQGLMRKSKVDETLIIFAGNILYALVLTFVIIAALSQLGINTTSLAAVIAAAGLAIGLALQGSLSNLAAGVMIILFRPFKNGDYVEAANTSGTIEEISIFTTKMRTPDNKEVIVPNGTIIANNIINYSAKPTRRVDLMFGVGYGDDLRKVKEILTRIVEADDRILKEPAPMIAVHELADNSVNLICRPWVATADYWAVYWDLMEKVKITFDEEGISIPFPQRDMHIVSDISLEQDKKTPEKKTGKKKSDDKSAQAI